ncbi:multidrug efflux system membrane fusion protein [Luteibacter sp. W1I16]|uniref:HlyD family efflux transporter periplasmic adaptor subunit n=1 Tax=Luteibacter sp. W1I16 TaxID=3373922 RepID=UPI003D1D6D63
MNAHDNTGPTPRGRLLMFLSFALAAASIVATVLVTNARPRTHDAYLFAFSAGMAPEVSGRIVELHVTNNIAVRKGQPLLVIDPEPFRLRLSQAQAQVAALQAEIDLTGRQVTSQGSGANAAARQVDRAAAQLTLARSTLARLEPLLPPGYVTTQQVDDAKAKEREAAAQLATAVQQASQAKEAIGDVASLLAQLKAAQAAEALAARDLRLTTVLAPFDGQVVGLNIAVGTFATAGHPLFTLIDSGRWYAVADFRETDLPGIHMDDQATVWLMGYEGQPMRGRVESLGAGVQPQGTSGPGLPSVDRNLNWVIVAQRFPVWIRLEHASGAMLRTGATASVRVDHGR